MKTLKERIQNAYKRNPHASGEQVLKEVGASNTVVARETLVLVQNDLRGRQPAQRYTKGEVSYGVTNGSSIGNGHDISIASDLQENGK
jgi:hypothetical protein